MLILFYCAISLSLQPATHIPILSILTPGNLPWPAQPPYEPGSRILSLLPRTRGHFSAGSPFSTRQWLACNGSAFPSILIQLLRLLGQVCVLSSMMKGLDCCRVFTPPRSEVQGATQPCGPQMVTSPALYPSPLPSLWPQGLQVPASDPWTAALQRLLNQLPHWEGQFSIMNLC